MVPITKDDIQKHLDVLVKKEVYVHLETTTGAYSAHMNENNMTVVAFIRNAKVSFNQAKITGQGPFRVGLKIDHGWIYAEGLTDWVYNEKNQLLMAGHDREGKLAIALQISETPFAE